MIIFNALTFRNFLSVGNNDVTIDLNDNKTTLIHGTNGSGKSTILDALCYCLFNKPFRKVNLPQLINSQNKKGMLTEVVFSIGKDDYIVRRGAKPKVFEVWKNGERLMAKAADKDNQAHLEQNILKLTYKSFTQIVILGSSNFVPFMQLPSAGRRECVEDFLDIKVFSTMAVIAKERLRGLKDRAKEIETEIGYAGYKIDLQQDRIDDLVKQSATDISEMEQQLTDKDEELAQLADLIGRTQEHEKNVIELAQQELQSNPQAKLKKLNDFIVKMQTKIERLNKDIKFFDSHDECPTCSQPIEKALANGVIGNSVAEKDKIEDGIDQIRAEMTTHEDTMRVVQGRQKHVQSLQKSIFEYQTKRDSVSREIDALRVRLRRVQGDTSSVDKERGKLELLQEELKELQDKIFDVQQQVVEHDIVANMLKDGGIKAQIVKKYLPVMNKYIRQYLTDLDFPIHFTLDEEFCETIASPLHQDFSYASFSEGQKARIDLALMLTWREIGKIKNSVTTNLLVLDEVFSSSLDEVGKEALLAILRYKLDDNQRVVVIDHTLSGEFKAKFNHAIEVSKVKGFSRYA